MAHGHGHVTAAAPYRGRLALVGASTVLVAAVQLAGGLAFGSLALLADAGHMLTDALGIGAALGAGWPAGRRPAPARTGCSAPRSWRRWGTRCCSAPSASGCC